MTIRKQLTTFAAIGVLNTAVDVTIYTLLIWLTVPLLLAIIISTTAGMVCSYVLNRRFTFKTNRQPIVQFICIHQHQSDVEFCVVPNRISRNKEKTPPIEVSFLGSGSWARTSDLLVNSQPLYH